MNNQIKIVSFSRQEFLIDVSLNQYFLTNPINFNKLVSYIQTRPKYYHWDVKRDTDLMSWIYASTKQLNDTLTLNTRIYWILHGIQSFKTCKNCGRDMDNKNVRSIYEGYIHDFCSDACAASYQETKDKKAQTTFEHYGVYNCMQSPAVLKQMQDDFVQKYGARTPMECPEFKRRFNESMQAKYGVDWPLQNPVILSAAMQTTFEHYGVYHPLQNESIKHELVQYYLDTYGVENPMQLPHVKQKVIDTTKQRFGIPVSVDITSPAQIPAIAKKISDTKNLRTDAEKQQAIDKLKSTCLHRYGVDNPKKSSKIQQQIEETCMRRYGVRNPMQCHEIQIKTHSKYLYDDLKFDSSEELAYFIWLKDNSISFEYQPDKTFEYEFNDAKYIYCPDFYIIPQNQFVEIKGDHFFNNGKMICPWRQNEWTDELYASICDKYEAKHQCMIKNNVKILKTSSDEVQCAVQYMKTTYGKDFATKCKI